MSSPPKRVLPKGSSRLLVPIVDWNLLVGFWDRFLGFFQLDSRVMVYADCNATTALGENARRQMLKAMECWGNPSSAHRLGREAAELLNQAREAVASAAAVNPDEVVFTSGGSEANSLAIMGARYRENDFRLVTSRIEHSSVRDLVSLVTKSGGRVEYARTLPSGGIDLDHLRELLFSFRPHLVSLMAANNETGVLLPTLAIKQLCVETGAEFHTDAVQAFGKIPSHDWNSADYISINAHKIHGPKGVGALIVKKGRQLYPVVYGGSQEIKRRGGTQNMTGIAGFGGACQEIASPLIWEKIAQQRNQFEKTLSQLSPFYVQGQNEPRLPNTSNLRFPGIPSSVLLSALDLDGVYVSAGSACSSGSISPSHVLLEMGLKTDEARECLRISFGKTHHTSDFKEVEQAISNHVQRIRERRALRRTNDSATRHAH